MVIKGAWQVASAIAGYKSDQLDDRGDIVMEGGVSEGMSGGPIFNMNGELIGINYAANTCFFAFRRLSRPSLYIL